MVFHSKFKKGSCKECPFNIIPGCGAVSDDHIGCEVQVRKARDSYDIKEKFTDGMKLFESVFNECTMDEKIIIIDELLKYGYKLNTKLI